MPTREEELYIKEMGRHPDRLPEDHPDAWQWEYSRLSREEREQRMAELLNKPPEIDGQEQLPL